LLTVFPVHAPEDAHFARDLCAFLESGSAAVCSPAEAVIEPGADLFSTVEACSADVLILLLSTASNPRQWPRAVWEPLLLTGPAEAGTHVLVCMLDECTFPQLLRRGSKFFDAATDRLRAMRQIKRCLRGLESGAPPAMHFSPDLETLYRSLDDQPGTCTVPGTLAERFAHEAARDFEAVLWIPAHGRNLTQIAGETGAQLQMTLEGTPEQNFPRIREVLSERRCLLVIDAPETDVAAIIPASGRTSVLVSSEPVQIVGPQLSLPAARTLFAAGRYAEAYELYYDLLNAGADGESCARDLIWICERWDRLEEANTLRFHLGPSPTEQLRLF